MPDPAEPDDPTAVIEPYADAVRESDYAWKIARKMAASPRASYDEASHERWTRRCEDIEDQAAADAADPT